MADAAQRGRRRRLRELWVTLHLTLGLTVGAIVALAGITGSLLVFYVELDRVIDPAVATSDATTPPRPIEDVFRALRAAHPERDRAWRLELPMTDGDPVTARYYRAIEKAHVAFAPLIVRIDPRTLEVGPARFWGDFAMTWIYDLHYTLLLDRTGRTIMAVVRPLAQCARVEAAGKRRAAHVRPPQAVRRLGCRAARDPRGDRHDAR